MSIAELSIYSTRPGVCQSSAVVSKPLCHSTLPQGKECWHYNTYNTGCVEHLPAPHLGPTGAEDTGGTTHPASPGAAGGGMLLGLPSSIRLPEQGAGARRLSPYPIWPRLSTTAEDRPGAGLSWDNVTPRVPQQVDRIAPALKDGHRGRLLTQGEQRCRVGANSIALRAACLPRLP